MAELDFNSLMNGHMTSQKATDTDVPKTINKYGNTYLSDPEMGLKLCADLISDSDKNNPISRNLNTIRQIIEQDFLPHTEADDNTVGAVTYSELNQLMKQLAEISSFPHLEKCYTVAVGGSFSAGKSRFLNSVLGCDTLLPTDTTPTTSIPTYISQGADNKIEALNFYNKKTQIDEDALKAICHAFNKRFGVTFSHLLQLISVERKAFKYENLIFLDTPGYSKSDDIGSAESPSEHNTDENIARDHLSRADYLIWLVDEQNGTIPQPDIEFIQRLELEQPVLVVISKADKKPLTKINEIVEVTKQTLNRAEVNCLDVIAYSAAKNTEYSATQSVLSDFFKRVNQGKSGSTLLWQLKRIFKNYINFYESKQQTLKLTNGTLNELIFDEGITIQNRSHLKDFQDKTKQQLNDLSKQKVGAEKIRSDLLDSVEVLCQKISINNSGTPNLVTLSAMHIKNQKTNKAVQQITCDGLVKGNIKVLSHLGSLANIKGEISKVAAQGLSIKVDADIELYVMQHSIKSHLGAIKLVEKFSVGEGVSVHIIDNKKCTVTIECKDN